MHCDVTTGVRCVDKRLAGEAPQPVREQRAGRPVGADCFARVWARTQKDVLVKLDGKNRLLAVVPVPEGYRWIVLPIGQAVQRSEATFVSEGQCLKALRHHLREQDED